MRALAGVVVAALLAAAAVPWGTGLRAERAYRDVLARVPDADAVEITAERYERGWLRSHATTVVRPLQGAAPGERLVVHHEIEHGPFPLGLLRESGLGAGPVLARTVSTATWEAEGAEGVPLPLRLVSVVSRRDTTLRLRPDPELAAERAGDLVDVDWEGMAFEARIARGGEALSGELSVPRIDADHGAAAFRLADLHWAFDYRRLAPESELYVGAGRLRIGALEVRAGDRRFGLHDLELRDTSRGADGAMYLEVDGALGSARQGGQGLGPVEWALAVNGLAMEPLATLSELSRRAEQAEDPAAAAEVQAELMGRMGELWPALMAPAPEVVLSRLRVGLPEGELRMTFRLGVDASDPAKLVHPLATIAALEVDAEAAVPRPLVHDWLEVRAGGAPADPAAAGLPGVPDAAWSGAARRVESLLRRGVLQRHGEHYVAEVRVRRGVLRVNGRILPVLPSQP